MELAAQPVTDSPASFSCKGHLDEVETAICNDEILRIYDREIAKAYGRLVERTGAAARTEQRAWLKERASCVARRGEATTGCLQDLLHARMRYLSARLAERSPSE